MPCQDPARYCRTQSRARPTCMNTDPTENIRREDQARINAEAAERAELVKQYGMVWSTDELREAFESWASWPLTWSCGASTPAKRVAAVPTISEVLLQTEGEYQLIPIPVVVEVGSYHFPCHCCAISTVIPQRRSDLRLFFRRYPQLPNELALLLAQDRACKMCHKILQQRFQFRTG